MNDHLKDYLSAMTGKKAAELADHLAGDVVLLSPVYAEPFEGRETVVQMLTGILETIDSIHFDLTINSGQDVGLFFTIRCDGIVVKGNERMHVNGEGLIDLIEVAFRPLAPAVLMQEKLANKYGGQPMRLVPATGEVV